MLRLKTGSTREAFNHSAFMGKWSTIISLIHPKDELSFKVMRTVSPRFHLVFVIGVN